MCTESSMISQIKLVLALLLLQLMGTAWWPIGFNLKRAELFNCKAQDPGSIPSSAVPRSQASDGRSIYLCRSKYGLSTFLARKADPTT